MNRITALRGSLLKGVAALRSPSHTSASFATQAASANFESEQPRQQRSHIPRRLDVNNVHLRGRVANDPFVAEMRDGRKIGIFALALNAVGQPFRRTAFVTVKVTSRQIIDMFASKELNRGVDVELHGMLTSHLPPGAKRSEVTVFTDELVVKTPTMKPFSEDSAQ